MHFAAVHYIIILQGMVQKHKERKPLKTCRVQQTTQKVALPSDEEA
jgi:hypothetical protein